MSYLIQTACDAKVPAKLNIIRCGADHGVGAPGHVNGDTTGHRHEQPSMWPEMARGRITHVA